MNLKSYNHEFSIFVFDENPVQARYLKETLAREGYQVQFYTSEDLFQQAIYLTLPHIVILPAVEKTIFLAEQVQKISREIQIFAVGPAAEGERLHRLLELKKIYDYVLDPVTLPAQFLHRIARGVETWMHTMIKEEVAQAPMVPAAVSTEEMRALDFIEVSEGPSETNAPVVDTTLGDLLLCESEEVAVQFALKRLQDLCRKDFIYLKHDLQNETLMLMDIASGMTPQHRQLGLKLDLLQDVAHFFLHPHDYKMWSDFLTRVFHADQTTIRLIKNKDTILGMVVALGVLNDSENKVMDHFCGGLTLILDNHFKSRLIFDHLPLEMKTFCLNNKSFYEKLNGEISRARRHGNTLSVVSFEVRSSQKASLQKGTALLAKIAQRFTRVSDFVGRLGDAKIAIALPQTEQDKAAFVASRLTLIAQKALSEKYLNDVEIVCGVSTFPQLANDAMSLLLGSEEASSQAQAFEVVLYTIESIEALDLQNS